MTSIDASLKKLAGDKTESFRLEVIREIKRLRRGKTLLVLDKTYEDEYRRKIVSLDAHRIYSPGRNISYPLDSLHLDDAVYLLAEIKTAQ